MKFKTLFMSDFDLPLFFNTSKQLLTLGSLNAECVQVSAMLLHHPTCGIHFHMILSL